MLSKDSTDVLNQRRAGWMDIRFNLISWALSCLTIRKYYSDIELITDRYGKNLLIDYLELPYSSFEISLEHLQKSTPNPNLWALGKIYSYSQQFQPFLHIDGDVFLWKSFEERLLHSSIVSQNKEMNYPFYKQIVEDILVNFSYVPMEILADRKSRIPIMSLNAGIIGGNDILFFQEYTKEALAFVNKNRNCYDQINLTNFNIVYEQYLCFCMAEQRGKEISYLFSDISYDYSEILQFHRLPSLSSFIHVVGYAKTNPFICEQIETRLEYEFPGYYSAIKEKIAHKFPWSKSISTSSQRREWLFNAYDFMKNKTKEEILDIKFIMNKKIEYVDDEKAKLVNPHNRQMEIKYKKDHNYIYQLFSEAMSINELYEMMKKAENISIVEQPEDVIKDKFLDLALQNFLYDEFLMVG